jgi:hypothetical protein
MKAIIHVTRSNQTLKRDISQLHYVATVYRIDMFTAFKIVAERLVVYLSIYWISRNYYLHQ